MSGLRMQVRQVVVGALVATLMTPSVTFAQSAAPPAGQQKVQLLFVQNSAGVVIDKGKGTLTLKQVSPSTLFFADRPVRLAGHYHTKEEFLRLWNEGPD